MSRVQEAEQIIESMTRGEKAELLRWIVLDLGDSYPGIEFTPGVCGGEPRVVRTRIPVWLLAQAKNLGAGDAKILECYPTLRAEDLVNAWGYIRSHKSEIEAQIKENEEA